MADTDPGSFEKAGEWLWTNRDWVMCRLRDLWNWITQSGAEGPTGRVLIIGPGGVGKSTTGQFLSGQYNSVLSIPGQYQASIDLERYALADDERVELIIPPGQRHRRDATWRELEATIGVGGYRGIILASSFGYHSLGQISYKHHHLYKEHGAKGFLPAFLDACRADEIDVLRRLSPHLRTNQSRCWVLTLVTKQDLWWPQHTEVELHYCSGEYAGLMNEVISQCGKTQVRHETVFASLVISNFSTNNNEILAKTAEGYDQNLQVASLRRLCETLYALKGWEEGK